MIRNERERNKAQEEKDRMVADLEAYADGTSEAINDEETRFYYEEGVRQRKADLAEYDRLRAGGVTRISGEGPNGLGAVLTKARIARDMTLAELGEDLRMSLQQVQRYESEGWHRASLWRLDRASRVLGLRITIDAELDPQNVDEPWDSYQGAYQGNQEDTVHARERSKTMTVGELIHQGVPLVPATRMSLATPHWAEGRHRTGSVKYRRRPSTDNGDDQSKSERSDVRHLLGCSACGANTTVYRNEWRERGYIDCSRQSCDAILTFIDEGTWVPNITQNPT